MNACIEMDGLLAERASGDLAPDDRERLDAHVRTCARCRAELARYEEAFGLVRMPRPAAGPDHPDLARSTLAAWKLHRRRRVAGLAISAGLLSVAAAAALVLAPGLFERRAPHAVDPGAPVASWDPDVNGAVEASAIDPEQDDEITTEDVALAALDAAQLP